MNFLKILVDTDTYNSMMSFRDIAIKVLIVVLICVFIYLVICKFRDLFKEFSNDSIEQKTSISAGEYIRQGFYIYIGMLLAALVTTLIGFILFLIVTKIIIS